MVIILTCNTRGVSRAAIFFINVRLGILVIATIPKLITKDSPSKNKKTDVLGAVTVTAGLGALVTALSAANQVSVTTMLSLAVVGIALLISFIFIEKRTKEPLLPFSIFQNTSVTRGNLAMLLLDGATIGLFFGISVYMQSVLQYDALTTGLAQLPLVGALIVSAGMIPIAMNQFGIERSLVVSLLLFAVGLIWLSFAPSNASFTIHLLGPTIVIGLGLGGALVATTALAVTGVAKQEEGLASGLVNSSQQFGGAVGITILVLLSSIRTETLASSGHNSADALTCGLSWVFIGAAIFAIIGAVLVTFVQRKQQQLQTKTTKIHTSK